jgi:fatty acid CoA ligase FadD9
VAVSCNIERINSYREWLTRFETAMNALPEEQRHQSVLTIMGPYRHPQTAVAKSFLPVERFRSAAEAAGHPIPRLSAAIIHKYVADLRRPPERRPPRT